MGVRSERKTSICPQWKLGLRIKYFWKNLKLASKIPINWFDSCNDSFFCQYKTHTSQESGSQLQCHCSDELAVHSYPLLCLHRRVVKVASGLFYCWSLLRNNFIATNLQRFTLYYGSKRFATCHGRQLKFFQRGETSALCLSFFRLRTMQCKWTFTKCFTLSAPPKKFPTKARAPFALFWNCIQVVLYSSLRKSCTFCHSLQFCWIEVSSNIIIIVNSRQL